MLLYISPSISRKHKCTHARTYTRPHTCTPTYPFHICVSTYSSRFNSTQNHVTHWLTDGKKELTQSWTLHHKHKEVLQRKEEKTLMPWPELDHNIFNGITPGTHTLNSRTKSCQRSCSFPYYRDGVGGKWTEQINYYWCHIGFTDLASVSLKLLRTVNRPLNKYTLYTERSS